MADSRDRRRRLNRGFGTLVVLGILLVAAGVVGLVHTGVATLTTMPLFDGLGLITDQMGADGDAGGSRPNIAPEGGQK